LHQVYDAENEIWTTLSPLPTARYSHSATVFGKTILLMGGTDGSNTLTLVEDYLPASLLYLMRKE
jgi:hypothetical protein